MFVQVLALIFELHCTVEWRFVKLSKWNNALNQVFEIYLKDVACTHCSNCFVDGFCKPELHGLVTFTNFYEDIHWNLISILCFWIFFLIKIMSSNMWPFHFLFTLFAFWKESAKLPFHFVFTLFAFWKETAKQPFHFLFTLFALWTKSARLPFHFFFTLFAVFISFSLSFHFYSKVQRCFSVCFQIATKVKRKWKGSLCTFFSKCKQSEKKVKTLPLEKNVFSYKKRFFWFFCIFF